MAQRLTDDGWRDPEKVLSTNVNTLMYQVPGGMLSNLIGQLKQAGKIEKYDEVLAEVPKVRKDFGYPPLVTPTSQIVGTQAVWNIISGKRYQTVTKESKALLAGEYGRLPGPVDPELRKAVTTTSPSSLLSSNNWTVIDHRPADDIPPELDKYRQETAKWIQQDEDVLSYALFPQVATKFFEWRQAQQMKADPTEYNAEDGTMPV